MKRFAWSLTSMALAGVVGTADAADLPSRRVAPTFASPAYSWSGFYVGANLGVGFGANRERNGSVFLPTNSVTGSLGTSGTLRLPGGSDEDSFFIGGGQVGYNYQPTAGTGIVYGIEADLQYLGMRGERGGAFRPGSYTFTPTTPLSLGLAFAPPAATVLTNRGGGLDYLGTVRGRIGYAFNNVLIFATGGLAFAGGGDNGGSGGDNDDVRFGYTLGGGVEYGFTPNLSVKVEGLYVSIDRGDSGSGRGAGAFNAATNTIAVSSGVRDKNLDMGLVRAGINYRF